MTENSIRHDHHGISVLEGQIKASGRKVAHLLHAGWGENDVMIAAVPSALAGLIVVGLLRSDVAQPGPRPADVDYDAGPASASRATVR